MATSTIPTPLRRMAQSAINFLQRVDSMTCVSAVHPIYFHKHPDDQFHTLDDIADEINIPAPIEAVNPIRNTSKSGTIRNIVRYREEIVSLQNDHLANYAHRIQYLTIKGFIFLFLQLLRIPLVVVFGILSLIMMVWSFLNETNGSVFILFTTIFIYIPFLYLLYSLIFEDYMFAIWAFNWQDCVPNGIYYTNNSKMSTVASKLTILQQNNGEGPKNYFQTGDWETLIPALRGDKIHTNQQYHRRWIQSPLDNEWIAVDVAFPKDITTQEYYHDSSKHIIIILHGMNGSSYAPYVRANVDYHNARGHTVVAMTQRVMGNSIILGIETFNAVRLSDIWLTIAFTHLGAGNGVIDELKEEEEEKKEKEEIGIHNKNIKNPLKLADNHILLNQDRLKANGYGPISLLSSSTSTTSTTDEKLNNNNNNLLLKIYYENLYEYQQIMIYKRYNTFHQVFKPQIHANPFYIPDEKKEMDILQYRKLSKKYTPLAFCGYSMGGIAGASTMTHLKQWAGVDCAVFFNSLSTQDPHIYRTFPIWLCTVVGGLISKYQYDYEYMLCDNNNIENKITNIEILKNRQEMKLLSSSLSSKDNKNKNENHKHLNNHEEEQENNKNEDKKQTLLPLSSSSSVSSFESQTHHPRPELVHFIDRDMMKYQFFPNIIVHNKNNNTTTKNDKNDNNKNNNNLSLFPTLLIDEDYKTNCSGSGKFCEGYHYPSHQHDDHHSHHNSENNKENNQPNTNNNNNNNSNIIAQIEYNNERQKEEKNKEELLLEQKYGYVDYYSLYTLFDGMNRNGMNKWQCTIDKNKMTSEMDLRSFDDSSARLSGWYTIPYDDDDKGNDKLKKQNNRCRLSVDDYYKQFTYAENERLYTLRTKMLIVHPQNDPVISVSTQYKTYCTILKEKMIKNDNQNKNNKNQEEDSDTDNNSNNGIDNIILAIPKTGGHIGMWQTNDDNFKTLSQITYDYISAIQQYNIQQCLDTTNNNNTTNTNNVDIDDRKLIIIQL